MSLWPDLYTGADPGILEGGGVQGTQKGWALNSLTPPPPGSATDIIGLSLQGCPNKGGVGMGVGGCHPGEHQNYVVFAFLLSIFPSVFREIHLFTNRFINTLSVYMYYQVQLFSCDS